MVSAIFDMVQVERFSYGKMTWRDSSNSGIQRMRSRNSETRESQVIAEKQFVRRVENK
jgi:hypothetical protein